VLAEGLLATELVDHAVAASVLDSGGWWAVVMTFEGRLDMWRFDTVRTAPRPVPRGTWTPVEAGAWTSSLGRAQYQDAVQEVRGRIRAGEVYQVNICRVLRAGIDVQADPWSLAERLAVGNPAPYAAVVDIPAGAVAGPGCRVVSASPELFLRREGDLVASSPIKGTGVRADDLLPKDDAENIMIVDLVRNDLQRVCGPGSVEVSSLLRVEQHPGLVHLVSTVQGSLYPGTTWGSLFSALSPPASVSGAPKSSALRAISDLEPADRGPYCGAVGWVDADRGVACLAVGIRTFWWDDADLCFGTGAGITWESDPRREWEETCLKARRLLATAGPEYQNRTPRHAGLR
jgi:para-aminobenzoate synthetase component 1